MCSLLALLVTSIREYLGINDTQISLLQGLAFAVFYFLSVAHREITQ